jgi:hypothetical protein
MEGFRKEKVFEIDICTLCGAGQTGTEHRFGNSGSVWGASGRRVSLSKTVHMDKAAMKQG